MPWCEPQSFRMVSARRPSSRFECRSFQLGRLSSDVACCLVQSDLRLLTVTCGAVGEIDNPTIVRRRRLGVPPLAKLHVMRGTPAHDLAQISRNLGVTLMKCAYPQIGISPEARRRTLWVLQPGPQPTSRYRHLLSDNRHNRHRYAAHFWKSGQAGAQTRSAV